MTPEVGEETNPTVVLAEYCPPLIPIIENHLALLPTMMGLADPRQVGKDLDCLLVLMQSLVAVPEVFGIVRPFVRKEEGRTLFFSLKLERIILGERVFMGRSGAHSRLEFYLEGIRAGKDGRPRSYLLTLAPLAIWQEKSRKVIIKPGSGVRFGFDPNQKKASSCLLITSPKGEKPKSGDWINRPKCFESVCGLSAAVAHYASLLAPVLKL